MLWHATVNRETVDSSSWRKFSNLIMDLSSDILPLLLASLPIDRLPDEVGVTIVPSVLLDHVDDDPSQAG
jgi:hypothetical protein